MAKRTAKISQEIKHSKLTIQFIDLIEEHRDLEIQEWNFKKLLQQYLSTLLEWQILYWE
jgi:predicted metal-dependent hydrolase